MGGVNVQAIAEIFTAIQMLIIVISGAAGLWAFQQTWVRLVWAAQLGGINSMGTRSYVSEAGAYFAGGLIAMNALGFAATAAGDLTGSSAVAWNPITVQTENPMLFVGEILVAGFWIIGISLVIKSGLSLPKISEGSATFSGCAFGFLFGALCMRFEWVNTHLINEVVPFNPLGLFFPEHSVISIQ